MYPDDFRYTKEHEWVSVDGAVGTIGITDHAQHELGDIVYVDLPKIGASITQGSTVGSVESVKAVSDIYSPVTGEVVEVNDALSGDPGLVNSDPYGAGWMIKLRVTNESELDALLGAEEYAKHVG